MSPLDALILGLVQGVTEFIPVSSSGHLIIAHEFLNVPNNFQFDVLLNIGTLVALVIYFRSRISSMLVDIVRNKNIRLFGYLVTASLPAVIVGVLFDKKIESLANHLYLVIGMIIGVGAIMVFFKNISGKKTEFTEVKLTDSIIIGLAQMCALVPGVSRSGSTILAGFSRKFSPSLAAEFSFMLAIPVIAGAIVKTAFSSEAVTFVSHNVGAVILGNIASFVSGILAVSILIRLVKNKGLVPFGYYRIVFGVVLILLTSVKIL